MISRSESEMSLVKIIYGLAFLLELSLIIHHINTYINIFILMHLFVVEFTSMGLTLVRFTLKKGAEVPENCVLACVNKVDLKDITSSRLCYHIYIYVENVMHGLNYIFLYLYLQHHWFT